MITAGLVVATGAITALKFVASWTARLIRHQKTDSLVSFTKSTRVEPIAMIDQRLMHLPYMPDVMQSLSSVFAGYYLQAVALAVNIGRVNVIKLLDALNPTRDVAGALAGKIVEYVGTESLLSAESYRYGLPIPGQTASLESHIGPTPATMGNVLDGIKNDDGSFGPASQSYLTDQTHKNIQGDYDKEKLLNKEDIKNLNRGELVSQDKKADLYGKDSLKTIAEATNLSVGKLLEVTITEGGSSATFPIMVRLLATIMGSSMLTHILGDGSRNTSSKERFHAWRAGQLEFWRDLVLCQDLIDDHKKVLAKDDSGVYDAILARRQGNMAAAALSSVPSIGTSSNLIVLSADTAKELELSVGGRLRDPKVRDKIFESTYIMIMVVVDTNHELVTFYHRGIALPSQLSVRELKVANKGTGPDVAEILKAYTMGQNPVL